MSQRSKSSSSSSLKLSQKSNASMNTSQMGKQAAPPPGQPPDKTTYTIAVKTSDVRNAGTDANVYVQLTGENGIGPQMQLKTSLNHRNKFERKRSDVFVFNEQKPLGALKQLKIWHDNSGIGPGWHLQVVEVNDGVNGISYVFPCNQWLCKKEGDRQISRVLTCSQTKQKIPKQLRIAADMAQQQGKQGQQPGQQPAQQGHPPPGQGWPQQPGQQQGWPQQPGQQQGWPQYPPGQQGYPPPGQGWPQDPGQQQGWPQQAPAQGWQGGQQQWGQQPWPPPQGSNVAPHQSYQYKASLPRTSKAKGGVTKKEREEAQ